MGAVARPRLHRHVLHAALDRRQRCCRSERDLPQTRAADKRVPIQSHGVGSLQRLPARLDEQACVAHRAQDVARRTQRRRGAAVSSTAGAGGEANNIDCTAGSTQSRWECITVPRSCSNGGHIQFIPDRRGYSMLTLSTTTRLITRTLSSSWRSGGKASSCLPRS